MAGLPAAAIGPGPLGLGAVYRGHGGSAHPGSLYIRYLYTNLKVPGSSGLSFRLGRSGYSAGGETRSDQPKIESVKAMRVTEKLIGEFGWSLFQRSYDGVRADWDHGFGQLTIGAFQPTQGGFEEAAGVSIKEIRVYTGAWTLRNDTAVPRNEVQLFFYDYDDTRPIRADRPDNSGLSTSRMNTRVRNFGFQAVGAYPMGDGEVDSLFWYSYQTGNWFDEDQRAQAVAAEVGYQWNGAGQLWLRGGYLRGTGDSNPVDHTHGTFFQMLSTTRKYSLSAAYNLMNNTDMFVQAIIRPSPAWTIRADYHAIGLSNANDRWYFGAGATQAQGNISGYGTRPSHGQQDFGKVFEVQATRTMSTHWSVTGYYGHIFGDGVIRGSFPGSSHFNFAFIENVLSF